MGLVQKPVSRKKIGKQIVKRWQVYLMMLPVAAFFIVFSYMPMYGIVIAFKDYRPSLGILGSEWIGFKHFEWLFNTAEFPRVMRNTIVISLLKIAFCFPAPLILALFMNEMRFSKLKKGIQTAVYLPNFISWVIIANINYSLFSLNNGVINNLISVFGGTRVNFMTNPGFAYPILIFSEIWKGAGWGTIIYISAMSGINPELYESAKIDGAGRLRMMWSITVPCILPIVLIQFILAVGNVMNAGFDAIFNLYNAGTENIMEILDTYAYKIGIDQGEFERSAALGLFKTVVNFALMMGANGVIKKINGYGIYGE